ncbi:hypothetical protein D1641_09620 [Colidextribacter sp. OB.20]|uniref:zinc ribbon-containing protein n=1 Tax=Colidextribacter sp. OB.20 TaxID=2304568 RepID=UPI001371EBCF|nr:zinc ribbon-containing protein [Colidextribacter sp. OB.20]NBI10266.1 hypothetical protein [Colidextribacter sp. OB.20]
MPETKKSQYEAGEFPPLGVYICMNCGGHTVLVPEMVKKLPTCSKCKGTIWMKI